MNTGAASIAPGGRRGPALGVADERHVAGRDHLDRQPRQLPAAPELERLELRVLEPHRRELLPRPLRRRLVRGRPGEARPVDGDEAVEELHDLRSREAFLANPIDHRPIDGLLAGGEPGGAQREKRDKDSAAIQHAELSRKTPVAVRTRG